ncbi:MAG: glycosyltransferase family 4 protein, partial [Chloroflexia bacterium]|nr:glycosyltransferase family 4 protein [Chloroflexia bacterium]
GVDIRKITATRLWTHGRLSLEMATRAPDLLLVPAHVIPLVHPRAVVTIHDLGYLHLPDCHPPRQRRMLDITTRWSARAAAAIIVPSDVTRRDLLDHYGTPPEKIRVIHHGVDARFRSVADYEQSRVRSKYELDRPYLLAVGTIHPRKNLPILAQAAAGLVASGRDLDLILVGRDGWMAERVHSRIRQRGPAGRVKTLDYVPAGDLPALYAGAACFVQPSLFEGFGMPVVEAMAAGTPVVCARTSALPEIAGNGAAYFDPEDGEELASVLQRILADHEYRRRLIERAQVRSRAFSWERCVSETVDLLEETVDTKG